MKSSFDIERYYASQRKYNNFLFQIVNMILLPCPAFSVEASVLNGFSKMVVLNFILTKESGTRTS